MLAPYDGAGMDLVALLRVMCGMPTGSAFKWAFKVEIHHCTEVCSSPLWTSRR